jgi:catechol 2,3-dioxygenase-like lactoylglutathione lyase family enzyme
MLGEADAAVTIAVSDMDVAKKFYGETLGLTQENESPAGVTYKSGNSRVFVYPSEYAGSNKATYAGWHVDNLEQVVDGLKSKGVQFEQYDNLPGATREGDIHKFGEEFAGAWFKDPSGNILALDNGAM